MDHKLHILVRLDIDRSSAVLAVNGCLTNANYSALLPVIRRASALVHGLAVVVDLRDAQHVEPTAADALEHSVAREYRHHEVGLVTVRHPEIHPVDCGFLASVPAARQLVAS